ncbi:hypothetical protein PENSTE_c002G05677 [Penicillium steckii]|uniref:F-box domain-containing protein n=1 Tax=Penicillium steckii TaxID=303698 RepID=A0A1V6TT13_9EURO|nr:hypothetical protein PENSTE_c002G05677 [Penicillium steckii]
MSNHHPQPQQQFQSSISQIMLHWDSSTFIQWMADPQWRYFTELRSWSDEEVIEQLTRDPMANSRHLQCTAPQQERYFTPKNASSLSLLGLLPTEILDHILGLLDLRSLWSFGATCEYSLSLTTNQSEFQLLQKLAPTICHLLYLTGLEYLHPIASVSRELRFCYCRSCGERGTLLCLPTCERICENCAQYNQAYWALLLEEAKTAFALEDQEVDPLPVLLTNRRMWRGTLNGVVTPSEPQLEYVTTKSVLSAAIKKRGSYQAMIAAAEAISPDRSSEATAFGISKALLYRYLRASNPRLNNGDPSQVVARSNNVPSTERIGIVTTLFPCVPEGWRTTMPTYRCSGCWVVCNAPFQIMNEHYRCMGIEPTTTSSEDRYRMVKGRSFIVRTLDELRYHISEQCLGAKLLMFRRRKMQSGRVVAGI